MGIKTVIVILSLVLITIGVNSQSNSLKYKLIKGKEYRLYQETQNKIIQNLGFFEQEIKNSVKSITKFRPIKFQGSNIELQTCFEFMAINFESLLYSMSYDSSKSIEENGKMGLIYDELLNKNFSIIITQHGEIIKIEGVNEIIENAVNGTKNLSAEYKKKIKAVLKENVGEEIIKSNMEILLGVYPEKKIAVGEKWNSSRKLNSIIKANLNNTSTLTSIESDKWKINTVGTVKTTGEKSRINQMNMIFDLKGDLKSEIEYNVNNGWVVKGNQKQNVSGTMVVDGSSQLPSGIEIPMTMSTITIIESR